MRSEEIEVLSRLNTFEEEKVNEIDEDTRRALFSAISHVISKRTGDLKYEVNCAYTEGVEDERHEWKAKLRGLRDSIAKNNIKGTEIGQILEEFLYG